MRRRSVSYWRTSVPSMATLAVVLLLGFSRAAPQLSSSESTVNCRVLTTRQGEHFTDGRPIADQTLVKQAVCGGNCWPYHNIWYLKLFADDYTSDMQEYECTVGKEVILIRFVCQNGNASSYRLKVLETYRPAKLQDVILSGLEENRPIVSLVLSEEMAYMNKCDLDSPSALWFTMLLEKLTGEPERYNLVGWDRSQNESFPPLAIPAEMEIVHFLNSTSEEMVVGLPSLTLSSLYRLTVTPFGPGGAGEATVREFLTKSTDFTDDSSIFIWFLTLGITVILAGLLIYICLAYRSRRKVVFGRPIRYSFLQLNSQSQAEYEIPDEEIQSPPSPWHQEPWLQETPDGDVEDRPQVCKSDVADVTELSEKGLRDSDCHDTGFLDTDRDATSPHDTGAHETYPRDTLSDRDSTCPTRYNVPKQDPVFEDICLDINEAVGGLKPWSSPTPSIPRSSSSSVNSVDTGQEMQCPETNGYGPLFLVMDSSSSKDSTEARPEIKGTKKDGIPPVAPLTDTSSSGNSVDTDPEMQCAKTDGYGPLFSLVDSSSSEDSNLVLK